MVDRKAVDALCGGRPWQLAGGTPVAFSALTGHPARSFPFLRSGGCTVVAVAFGRTMRKQMSGLGRRTPRYRLAVRRRRGEGGRKSRLPPCRSDGRRLLIPGHQISVRVPFDGGPDLFGFLPSSVNSSGGPDRLRRQLCRKPRLLVAPLGSNSRRSQLRPHGIDLQRNRRRDSQRRSRKHLPDWHSPSR